ncbi:hypothetical protein KP509_04G045300 [Ceratopteris richardii]|uniref:Probable zinc-ribbon domain-containing protein n=1 Tax=Ceratopteris richardii TaxID=49495 RepID=A0A8T2UZZ4_CERRI|nr:hypothetical protein KP509_04G045300 [Ceratopteris richardii]
MCLCVAFFYLYSAKKKSHSQNKSSQELPNENTDAIPANQHTDNVCEVLDKLNGIEASDYMLKDGGYISEPSSFQVVSKSENGSEGHSHFQSQSAISMVSMCQPDAISNDIINTGEECKNIRTEEASGCGIAGHVLNCEENQCVDAEEAAEECLKQDEDLSKQCDKGVKQQICNVVGSCDIVIGGCLREENQDQRCTAVEHSNCTAYKEQSGSALEALYANGKEQKGGREENESQRGRIVEHSNPIVLRDEDVPTVESVCVDQKNQEGCKISNGQRGRIVEHGNPRVLRDEDVPAVESVCVDQKKISNGTDDMVFESEVVRDTECELSFKYICSSLNSNRQLGTEKRAQRFSKLSQNASVHEDQAQSDPNFPVGHSSSNNDDSEASETYSALSESSSDDISDSGFDFPSPSEENKQSAKLLEEFVHGKQPSSCNVAAPHQLEWQDASYDSKLSISQDLNGPISLSADGMVPSDVYGGMDRNIVEHELSSNTDFTKKQSSNQFSEVDLMKEADSDLFDGAMQGSVSGIQIDSTVNEGRLVNSPSKKHKLKSNTEFSIGMVQELQSSLKKQNFQQKPEAIIVDPSTSSSADINWVYMIENSELMNDITDYKDSNSKNLFGCTNNTTQDEHQGEEKDLYALQPERDHQVDHSYYGGVDLHHGNPSMKLGAEMHQRIGFSYGMQGSYSTDASKGNKYRFQETTLNETFPSTERHNTAAPKIAEFPFQNPYACRYGKKHPNYNMEGDHFRPNNLMEGPRVCANASCSYHRSLNHLMIPMQMPGHVCCQYAYEHSFPIGMQYSHCQHLHASPFHVPPCIHCLQGEGHYQVHSQASKNNQNYQIQPSYMPSYPPACLSARFTGVQDTVMPRKKPLKSERRLECYPPLPQGGAVPYVICRLCKYILQVPVNLFPGNGAAQKLRCSSCGKVSKFRVPDSMEKSDTRALRTWTMRSSSGTSQRSVPSVKSDVKSREFSTPAVSQSAEPSYGRNLHSQYNQGSISAHHRPVVGISEVVNKNMFDKGLQREMTLKMDLNQHEISAQRSFVIDKPISQDEFFFKTLSRKSEVDTSQNLFDGFKTVSPTLDFNSVSNHDPFKNNNVSLDCIGDEKDEGLDFGAPRASDGESLDPESRMRSPENIESVDQLRCRSHSFGEHEPWVSEIEGFKQKCNMVQDGKPKVSLIKLLNQESVKFAINIEESGSFEDFMSASGLLAANSPIQTEHRNLKVTESTVQAQKHRAQGIVRKGSKYVATLVTRSLRGRFQ